MNDKAYRAFLNLMMCSDPWPVYSDNNQNQLIMEQFANEQAKARGYRDWIHAFHEFPSDKVVKENQRRVHNG